MPKDRGKFIWMKDKEVTGVPLWKGLSGKASPKDSRGLNVGRLQVLEHLQEEGSSPVRELADHVKGTEGRLVLSRQGENNRI